MNNDILIPKKKLGFGLMRLPVTADNSIDIPQVCAMVDDFIKRGFTYFDTAYVYHGGRSETAVKTVLTDRYPRESFTLATKLPSWALKEPGDVEKVFQEQLERTGAGYFDYYLLHAVSAEKLPVYDRFDCWNWGFEMKKKGLIRHFGFSFHDTAEVLDQILTAHPEMDFVQLQINYMDWEDDSVQSRKCYEVARKHGKPVVIMEPVKGGTLAALTEKPTRMLQSAAPDASIPSWALRFAASLDGVLAVLSGMSDPDQVADNLHTFDPFVPLNAEEQKLLKDVVDVIRSVPTIPCTGCRYCVDGCPQKIQIPDLLKCNNLVRLYGLSQKVKKEYADKTKEDHGLASACIQCGQCEGVCPQHIGIIDALAETAKIFEQ